MSIGIAICCYKGHLPYLARLLYSLEQQTRQPDQVVVSCSSANKDDIPIIQCPFPLTIVTHAEKKNASQNRNYAAWSLSTDIVCFFDADDVMHPQRLEWIERGFQDHNTMILIHNIICDVSQRFTKYDIPRFYPNRLSVCPWGATQLHLSLPDARVHNGHVTVRREAWQEYPFPEGEDAYGKEDTVFCTTIISAYSNQTLYCYDALSKYYPSCTRGVA